jgi:hypothetical protein
LSRSIRTSITHSDDVALMHPAFKLVTPRLSMPSPPPPVFSFMDKIRRLLKIKTDRRIPPPARLTQETSSLRTLPEVVRLTPADHG